MKRNVREEGKRFNEKRILFLGMKSPYGDKATSPRRPEHRRGYLGEPPDGAGVDGIWYHGNPFVGDMTEGDDVPAHNLRLCDDARKATKNRVVEER